MKSRRASRRSSAEPRLLNAASDAASSQRRRVGKNTIAGSKLYDPSAASKVAGGISGMRSFMNQISEAALPLDVRECWALPQNQKQNSRAVPRGVGVAQKPRLAVVR